MYIKQSANNAQKSHKRHSSQAASVPKQSAVQNSQNQLHQYQEGMADATRGKNTQQPGVEGSAMMQDLVKHFNKGSLSKTDLKLLQKYCETKGLNYQSVILGAAAAAQNSAPATQVRQPPHQSVGNTGASGQGGANTGHHSTSQRSLDGRDKYKSQKYAPLGNRKGSDAGIVTYKERQLIIGGPSPDKKFISKPNQVPNTQTAGNYPQHQAQPHTASNGYFSQQPSPVRISSSKVISTAASGANSGKQTPEMNKVNQSQQMKKQSLFVYDHQQKGQPANESGSGRPMSSSQRGQNGAQGGSGNVSLLYEQFVQSQSQKKLPPQNVQQQQNNSQVSYQRTSSQNPIPAQAQAAQIVYKGQPANKQNPFKRGQNNHHTSSTGSLENNKKFQTNNNHSQKPSLLSGSGSVIHHQNYVGGDQPTTSQSGLVFYAQPQNQLKAQQKNLDKQSSNLNHKRSKSKQGVNDKNQQQFVKAKQYQQQHSVVQNLIHGNGPQGNAQSPPAPNSQASNRGHQQYQHRSGAMTSTPNSPQGKGAIRYSNNINKNGQKAPFVLQSQGSTAVPSHQTAHNSVTNSQSSMGVYLHSGVGSNTAGTTPANLTQRKNHNSQSQSKLIVQKTGKQVVPQSQRQSPHPTLVQQQYANEYTVAVGSSKAQSQVKMHPSLSNHQSVAELQNNVGYSTGNMYDQNKPQHAPRLQASGHHHSSSQPALHRDNGAAMVATKGKYQTSGQRVPSQNVSTQRKGLREMTPQLMLQKNSSQEMITQQQLQAQAHGAQKSSGRHLAQSSSVLSVGSNGVPANYKAMPTPQGNSSQQYSMNRVSGRAKMPTSDIKPILQKNASQTSLRASLGSVGSNHGEPYINKTNESHRKHQHPPQLMNSGGGSTGNNNSLHLSDRKNNANPAPSKIMQLQAQYASDQSTGASNRRKQGQAGSSGNRATHKSSSGQQVHYKNRPSSKIQNVSGVAPYDQSNQSKHMQQNSLSDSLQNQGSIGSTHFNQKQEFVSQQMARANEAKGLSIVSGQSSHRFGPNSHKRTSSVTNNSNGANLLQGNSSGFAQPQSVQSSRHATGSSRHGMPSSASSKQLTNRQGLGQNPGQQHLGARRLSQPDGSGAGNIVSSVERQNHAHPQRQMRSDQRKPPGPIKEHLLEDSPIISSLEQFQLDIELRHQDHLDEQILSKNKNRVQMNPLHLPVKEINSHELEDDDGLMSSRRLLTEQDEHEIRQVAADINERAFYGKILKTKKALRDKGEFAKLSPRSQEIGSVMKAIKSAFEATGLPPITLTNFYRIGKILGRGAFGKVNLAMHKLVRKLVALKSLGKDQLTNEEEKAKLMKEVNLLLKLRHNHVVKIYETIETDKHIIIVMEICAGGDLLNYVRKRRRLKEPYAQKIFKQIVDGLCYIHSKLIAHRDIKLDNILLDGRGNVKIGDFGVSKQTTQGSQMKEQCGTPAYIAPEILRNKGYGLNVDIWSAGVVLFAMLYGTVPFKAQSMQELHQLILKGKYTLKEDVSANARSLLRGLLEIDPVKRITIKQIYEHPWLKSYDNSVELFNEEEREMIKKEYTYNDASRYNRNENEEPVDCFTEHNFESVYTTLKNHSSKSIILAPFNSTMSDGSIPGSVGVSHGGSVEAVILQNEIRELMESKQRVIKFSKKCREIDRQYEFNNNGQLDNGVYHKNIAAGSNSFENDAAEESNSEGGIEIEQSLSQGEGLPTSKSAAHNLLSKQLRAHHSSTRTEDPEMVVTYETFQEQASKGIEEDKVNKLCQYGYPNDYVLYTMRENEPNYCTAGYYLLDMDQNYC